MARSRGQIRKRGPEKYLVRIYLGRIDGKRKYTSRVVNGSEEEAEKVLTRMLARKDAGKMARPSTKRFEDHLEEWLEFKEGKVAPSTLANYKKIVRTHLKPALGYRKLRDVDTRLCQVFVDDLKSEKGLAHSYIRVIRSVLHDTLQQAVKWNLIDRNPASSGLVELPKKDRDDEKDRRTLTAAEVKRLMKTTRGDRLHALWAVLLGTGLRPQEALGLKWKDFDEQGFMHVRRVVALADPESREWHVTENMKTERARRSIKVPGFVQKALDSHRAIQAQEKLRAGDRYNREGFVFACERGDFLRVRYVRRRFYDALEKAEIEGEIRLYDTRHTHLSQLINDGESLKLVSAQAGHSSVQTTGDVYAHVTTEGKEKLAQSVEARYGT